ncbi:MFS transporter [Rhodococcus opacus]|uniref:MFS transporter n=1 Tax=Rhodococcus opacus TaxID=37919 RepID=UPI002474B6EA|nr:MFS transporter [Rhodococcus opacus]MDH6291321.1 MHS family shikimate/dehydroshikimate transporter-like MFS transporter [Rhodococcus opacus]
MSTGNVEHPAMNGGRRSTRMQRRVQLSAYLGALVEWYDFFIYGFASAVVLNTLFFPELDPAVGTIAAFATLAAGYLTRPLGALLFTHFGDRIGRARVLVITLMMMGIASTLIGLLPTYDSIGIWAPLLLVALRLLQGISAGGEYGGAVLLTVEHASDNRRGFAASFAQLGVFSGLLLANGVFIVASLLPDSVFLSWGWRVPFLASVVLIAIAAWVRSGVTESPVFEEARDAKQLAKRPLVELFRSQWRPLLVVVLLMFGVSSFSAFESSFITAYAKLLGFTTTEALAMTLIGTVLGVIVLPLSALASDRVGRRPIVTIGVVLMIVAAALVFPALHAGSLILAIVGVAALWVSHSSAFGPLAAWMSELFPTKSRFGGVSIGYQIGATAGSGLFPLIGASLLEVGGGVGNYGLVLGYVIVGVVVTLVGTRMARETAHGTLADSEETAPSPANLV